MEENLAELERYTYDSENELVEWIRERVNNLEYEEILLRLGT
jgi:hypothetical protein